MTIYDVPRESIGSDDEYFGLGPEPDHSNGMMLDDEGEGADKDKGGEKDRDTGRTKKVEEGRREESRQMKRVGRVEREEGEQGAV